MKRMSNRNGGFHEHEKQRAVDACRRNGGRDAVSRNDMRDNRFCGRCDTGRYVGRGERRNRDHTDRCADSGGAEGGAGTDGSASEGDAGAGRSGTESDAGTGRSGTEGGAGAGRSGTEGQKQAEAAQKAAAAAQQKAAEEAAAAAQKQAAEAAAKTAMEEAILVQKGISRQEYDLLAALIQCEAGGESYIGQVAVGNVVMNRMESGKHPDNITGVVYEPGQFSPVRNGSLKRTLGSGNISASCRQAALEAIAGSEPVGDKLFFRRVNGRSGQVIGNHVFY